MKRITLFFIIASCTLLSFAQSTYWVFFTDKAGTTFDPYTYFDSKAIERRVQLGISLYDETDFPLNQQYVEAVTALSEEVIGHSRWFNALAVTTSNIEQIEELSFVEKTQLIESHGKAAWREAGTAGMPTVLDEHPLAPQLIYMQGEEFVNKGYNGKGIRIAVLDGGFKMADTHPSFQHLRDNHQIIKTFNFPLKKEDVYGWDSHGTMVLSCIAGYGMNSRQLGLATGAEFLLARTETDLEQPKEEVWWMMGMEWADANGANIINSSLGYGKDRYNPEEMDGTSMVAKAANMAASKGILVCNSMGNEGDDRSWRTLITPADAEGVLSVGGIDHLGEPSSFTSLGPTADGRRKPNVCAFGTAEVANPSKQSPYTSASGTSFASPLAAGFAACAWQTHPQWTNIQLLHELEKSGDMYPYYDYQYGYGVPQASYFTGNRKAAKKGSIILHVKQDGNIVVEIPEEAVSASNLRVHLENQDGKLENYRTIQISKTQRLFPVNTKGKLLRLWYNGEVVEYDPSKQTCTEGVIMDTLYSEYKPNQWTITEYHDKFIDRPSKRGVNARFNFAPYFSWGFVFRGDKQIEQNVGWGKSQTFLAGIRMKGNICKWYSLGCAVELGATLYNYDPSKNIVYPDLPQMTLTHRNIRASLLQGEVYQRFRVSAGGLFGYGIYFDTGVTMGWIFARRDICQYRYMKERCRVSSRYSLMKQSQFGVRVRFGYDIIAAYAQYRFTALRQDFQSGTPSLDFPRWEAGLQLTLPLFSR